MKRATKPVALSERGGIRTLDLANVNRHVVKAPSLLPVKLSCGLFRHLFGQLKDIA